MYHDYSIVHKYAIRVFENVNCIYIAEIDDSNSYFIGFDPNSRHAIFIPAGCHKQFVHTICKESDEIGDNE